LTKAFATLANAPFLSAEKKIDCIATLSKAAGDEGMVGGQVVDLLSENGEINSLSVDWMNVAKTGALFQAAFEFGAILGEYEEKERASLSYAALLFGLFYQMVDDLTDGKEGSSDQKKKKGTSLLIYGEKGIKRRAKHLLNEGLKELDQVAKPLENTRALLSAMTEPLLSNIDLH
ncbi:MAG: polyprenyl synthetase family protein, partial [Simkania negevensis]|nr:polyprenyl synthetase family protein [Simkania negevensis]